jgi:acetyl-CoA carboxylase carboxyltransferase component
MGAEQAATTMAIVMEDSARARGHQPDRAQIEGLRAIINATFEKQTSAFYTSGRMLDDGVIDPRDTRAVLGFVLSLFRRAPSGWPCGHSGLRRPGPPLNRKPECSSHRNTTN